MRFPRPKSSIPRIHGDPMRFRGRHEQIHVPAERFGHHVEPSRTMPNFRTLMFRFLKYNEED